MNASAHITTSDTISESDKNTIIIGVLISMLLAALDQTIVAPAMPTIGHALGHADYLPWIVTAYLLTATAMSPLYGKISDIHGRRPTIYAAILIFLAGSVVSALAPNMFVLIAGRAIQGLGGGGLMTMAQTVIGDLVPPKERARYAAWISGTWAAASVAGPLLGGVFAQHVHWSLIFWINLPLALLAMAMINNPLKKLPLIPHEHSIDWLGAGLLVLATAVLLLMLNWGGVEFAWMSAQIIGLAIVAALLWFAFALRLMKAREPLISLPVLRNPVILAGTLCMFALQGANVGVSVYFPIYLQAVEGLTVAASGMGLLGLMLGTVAGAATSGKIISRVVHYRRVATAGILLSLAAMVVLALTASSAPFVLVELLMILIGFGTGAGFPVCTVAIQNAVDRRNLGVATGVLSFSRSLGAALGVALLGAVALAYGVPLAAEGAQAEVSGVDVSAFRMIFLAGAGMGVLALVLILMMPEKPLRATHDAPPVLD